MKNSLLRKRRSRQKSTPQKDSPPPPPTYVPSRIDINLSRLANLATACTLLLAAFGYFYTVRPVFQNQKLQEDNSRLELARSREQQTLAELRERQSEVQQKITELDAALINAQQKALASDERARIAEEREQAAKNAALMAENRERDAIISAKDAANKLATELRHLDNARRTILVANFTRATGFLRIRQHYDFSNALYKSENQEDGQFLVHATALFLSPTKILGSATEVLLNSPERIPDAYFAELKKAIAKETPINCVIPDADKLKIEYIQRYGQIDVLSSADAHAEIERQRAAAETANSRLIVTEKDIKSLTISYAVGRRYALETEFQKKIIDADSQCNLLLQKAVERITHKVGPKNMSH
ncbi:hypothetical protein [Achromobacter xylosoxidans]|uniref:hypothetical protein n=1 Tax=Alcaligenes xylosoxydans xylosoxydans TaxID=85698 RepID=UPI0006C731F3|nr:hypothetical protein [Achromobacter xylosoxidans]MDH0523458.1 hypothetical protein [Achromobacter xylosoxidans]MDH0542459.1 hypothetical protein [Achromobacter xylosoxidans]CUJ16753.1 Uncharacterised protein [Achromobacter xylosoxidans]